MEALTRQSLASDVLQAEKQVLKNCLVNDEVALQQQVFN
jgi:hypothetical protein